MKLFLVVACVLASLFVLSFHGGVHDAKIALVDVQDNSLGLPPGGGGGGLAAGLPMTLRLKIPQVAKVQFSYDIGVTTSARNFYLQYNGNKKSDGLSVSASFTWPNSDLANFNAKLEAAHVAGDSLILTMTADNMRFITDTGGKRDTLSEAQVQSILSTSPVYDGYSYKEIYNKTSQRAYTLYVEIDYNGLMKLMNVKP